MESSISDLPTHRRFIREWLPPGLRTLGNRLLGGLTVYRGPYADWSKAQAATAGYQHDDIIGRVRRATECVLRGEADYEQDGVAKRGEIGASHALQALLLIAALDGGRLSVLDLGGGLGSHFLRWRTWLAKIPDLHWCVVEQPHFAEAGTDLFANEPRLSFTTSVSSARANTPNVVLASSVLHYLPDPLAALDELAAVQARGVVLDRMPLAAGAEPLILTQHVPKSLGRASYPLWFLPRETVHSRLRGRYTLLSEFTTHDAPLQIDRVRGDSLGSIWLRTT